MFEVLMAGVSEQVPSRDPGDGRYGGVSESAVSRETVAASEGMLKEFVEGDP